MNLQVGEQKRFPARSVDACFFVFDKQKRFISRSSPKVKFKRKYFDADTHGLLFL